MSFSSLNDEVKFVRKSDSGSIEHTRVCAFFPPEGFFLSSDEDIFQVALRDACA